MKKAGPIILMVAPVAIILIGLFLMPQFYLFRQSISLPPPVGIDTYLQFFSERFYLDMLGRTFLVAGLVTLICILCGFPLALWLARIETRFVPLLLLITTFPLLVSAVVRSFAWMVLFFRNGLLSQTMAATGLVSPGFQFMGATAGVVIALGQVMLPLMIITLYSVLRTIDRDLENAAMNLGASPWSTTWLVIVPQMKGGILAGSLLVFSLSVGAFATPSLIGGSRVNMMAIGIQEQALELFDWPFAAAMAMILLAAALIIAVVYGRIISEQSHEPR